MFSLCVVLSESHGGDEKEERLAAQQTHAAKQSELFCLLLLGVEPCLVCELELDSNDCSFVYAV